MPDIVVFGSLNVDLVLRVPVLPLAGQTVLGGRLHRSPGGKGANQAVAAARFARSRRRPLVVRMVGRIGDDADGRLLHADLAAAGVDTEGVRLAPSQPTGTALVLVDGTGENLIAVAPGANAAIDHSDVVQAANGLRAGDVVVCQLEVPLAAVTALAAATRAAGARLVCNAAPAIALGIPLLATIDVLVVNEREAETVLGAPVRTPAAAAAAAARAGCAVVVTLGAAGAVHGESSGVRGHCPAPQVTTVDSVGAGDAFVGALAVGLAHDSDLAGAVAEGVAAGSLAVTRPGARPASPPAPVGPEHGSDH